MSTPPLPDEVLQAALDALESCGGNKSAAARELGLNRETFRGRLAAAQRRFQKGYGAGGIGAGPERDGLEPYVVRGVSTYFDADGQQKGQWVKTKVDDLQRLRAIESAITARAERVEPLPPLPMPEPTVASAELLNLITITDYHIGMLAWGRETGADWDIKIAAETFTRCFGGLMAEMPAADVCVINQLGDFLHTDGLTPVTPASRHVLDADSRYMRMAESAVDLLEMTIAAALRRHRRVELVISEGNHDESGSAWLRILFRRLYANEPRVTVADNVLPYHAITWGSNFIGFHHGHKLKMEKLPSLFASAPRFRAAWGAAKRSYLHCGHYHHWRVIEEGGATVEQHPTLAAPDAYSARGGWISDRRAFGIAYHRRFGERWRLPVVPEMYQDAA
ncbi:MAG: helix-turn-helix domain-containing protein [Novosphingobium sp.]